MSPEARRVKSSGPNLMLLAKYLYTFYIHINFYILITLLPFLQKMVVSIKGTNEYKDFENF